MTFSPKIDQSGTVVVCFRVLRQSLGHFDRFYYHPEKKHCTLGYVDFHQNFNGERFSVPQTVSVNGIAMRSLELAALWHFETHRGHFCITNPKKFSERRAQTDNSKSISLPQLLLKTNIPFFAAIHSQSHNNNNNQFL